MITVSVCVGSSCHLKGAPDVIERFQSLIAKYDLWNQVTLKGVFCLERCTVGVTVDIDGEVFSAVSPEAAEALFETQVLARLGRTPDTMHTEANDGEGGCAVDGERADNHDQG